MDRRGTTGYWRAVALGTAALAVAPGCRNAPSDGSRPHQTAGKSAAAAEAVPDYAAPKELSKSSLPEYVIEPPDVLVIDTLRLVPLPPYRVEAGDSLFLSAPGAPAQEPIHGIYPVDPDGTIHLGASYGGRVRVADLTAAEAEAAVSNALKAHLRDPAVQVTLAQTRNVPPIRGEHRVRPDGTVGLGSYGSVAVAGLTVAQAKQVIEAHLARALVKPEVSVEIQGFNSKFGYVITDGGAGGELVTRFAVTGNETVLDAIALVGVIPSVSTRGVWVARPAPAGSPDQILPVDWAGVSRRGQTRTNYQLLPGDRVFVMARPPAAPAPTTFERLCDMVVRPTVAAAPAQAPAATPPASAAVASPAQPAPNPAVTGGPAVVRTAGS